MKNFEFKSKICTTKEQSERLLALGLKKETADMVYITSEVDGLGKPLPEEYRYYRLEIGDYHKPIGKGMLHIPAWSLHRLIEISAVNNGRILMKVDIPVEVDFYNEIVNTIESLIKSGLFNKDYLEEKK